jgi:cyanophycinase
MVVLMGGSTDVAEAFQAQIVAAQGGDPDAEINVVILRTSQSDGYNAWIMALNPKVVSVVSILMKNRSGAYSTNCTDILSRADMVFLAGGDQATYVEWWTDTPLSRTLQQLRLRNVPLGGTSAGLAVLGDVDNAALTGGIESDAALLNPYDSAITLNTSFLFGLPGLHATITDTHFVPRERMGRLLVFLARMTRDVPPGNWQWARGVGVNETTAVLVHVDPVSGHAIGTVVGTGNAYFVQPSSAPEVLEPRMPLGGWEGIQTTRAETGARFDMTTWTPLDGPTLSYKLAVEDGVITSSTGSVY